MEKLVKVLWTGGSDSTYRILELSKKNVTIQPYYVVNKGRPSLDNELKAMDKIRDLIIKKETTKALLLPTIFLDINNYYPLPEKITRAFNALKKTNPMGQQNMWLSLISQEIEGLERSFEYAPPKKENDITSTYFVNNIHTAALDLYEEEGISYYMLSEDNNSDLLTIFGNARFPSELSKMTKRDMYERMVAWGDLDVFEQTWFCSIPIDNEPCGYCGPCRTAIEQNMGWRFPSRSLKRHKLRYYWLLKYKLKKTYKQLTRLIKA